MDLKLLLSIPREEIHDFFIVELKHRDLDHEIDSWSSFDRLYHMLERSRDNSHLLFVSLAALHGMGLSRSRLAIGKDGSIITLKDTFNNGQRGLIKNAFLFARGFKGHIKAEHSLFFSNIFCIGYHNLSSFWINMDYSLVSGFLLVFRHRSTTDGHLHAFIFIAHLNLETKMILFLKLCYTCNLILNLECKLHQRGFVNTFLNKSR